MLSDINSPEDPGCLTAPPPTTRTPSPGAGNGGENSGKVSPRGVTFSTQDEVRMRSMSEESSENEEKKKGATLSSNSELPRRHSATNESPTDNNGDKTSLLALPGSRNNLTASHSSPAEGMLKAFKDF